MDKRPLFSIIIPTKNPNEEFFKECLESVFKQTYSNYELIVVANNCTEDKIAFIKKEIKQFGDKVNLVITTEYGVSRARNIGIDNSNGEYIVFLDDDDILNLCCVEEASSLLTEYNVDLIVFGDTSNFDFFNSNNFNSYIILKHESFFNSFFPAVDSERQFETRSVWGKVYSKKVIYDNNISFMENLEIGEDVLFSSMYARAASLILVSDFIGIFYRCNFNSAINRYDCKITDKVECFLNCYKNYLYNEKIDASVYYNYAFNHSLINIFKSDIYHNESGYSFFEKRKRIKLLLNDDIFSEVLAKVRNRQIINKKKKILLFFLKIRFYFVATLLLEMRFK